AGRHHQVAVLQRLDHVQRGQVAGYQAVGIEVDEYGPVLAADDDRRDRAGHDAEGIAYVDAADVLDVGLVERRVTDREDAERQRAGRVERHYDRRQRVRRQIRQR